MATVTERLALLITAPTAGAVRNVRELVAAEAELKSATGASEKEIAALEKRVTSAGATLKSGLGITALQSKLALLGPTGVRVSAGIDTIGAALAAIGPETLVAGAAAAVGIGLIAKATAAGVTHFEDIADQARAFQRATGASAEEASRFAGTMRLLGNDATQGGVTALSLLGKKISENSKDFAKFGVEIARNKAGFGDIEGTLFNVADRYKQLTDQGNKAAAVDLARSVLGRGFKEFNELLARGSAGIKAFYSVVDQNHEVLNQDQIDKARELQIAGTELSQAWQGVEVQLAEKAVPALISLTHWLTNAIHAADQLALPRTFTISGLEQGATGRKTGRDANGDLVLFAPGQGNSSGSKSPSTPQIIDAANALADLKKQAAEATTNLNDARSAVEGVASADESLVTASDGVAAADRSVTAAQRGVVDALHGERDAREHLNDVLARGEEVTHAIDEAQRNLAKSTANVADAQQRVLDAQKKINDLRAGPSARDKEKAQLAVTQAQLGVSDAQKALDAARHPTPGTNRFAGNDPAQQADAVAHAEANLESAGLTLADAQDALNTLLNEGADNSDAMTTAQKDLTTATSDLEQATHDQSEAQRAVNTAEQGVAAHEREIRDARETLATATQHVAEAHQQVADASTNAAKAREAYTTALVNSAKAHDLENQQIAENLVGLQLLKAELEALANESPAIAAALAPILDRVNADILTSLDQQNIGAGNRIRGGSIPASAYGDIYSRPTVALFGEDGPEMVLPLSPDKRAYALRLLSQSGLTRNIPRFANGGIVGLSRGWQGGPSATNGATFMLGPIYASGRSEGEAAGAAIVDALVRYQRRNGGVPIRATG